jgi:hypothetical protein
LTASSGHLSETLLELGVASELIAQVLGLLAPLRAEIVTALPSAVVQ